MPNEYTTNDDGPKNQITDPKLEDQIPTDARVSELDHRRQQ